MAIILAMVQMPSTSGIPRDTVVNTFTFGALSSTTGAAAEITDALDSFYNDSYGGTQIAALISSTVSRTESTLIEYYDLEEPKPRVPFAQGVITLGAAAASSSLPQETALCLSFHADMVSGSSPRRRRGRVYIGPLATTAATSSSQEPARPTSSFINALSLAGTALAGYPWGTVNAWGVYSRVDQALRPVVGGWVDNEFDTQRRRGRDATDRTIWSV